MSRPSPGWVPQQHGAWAMLLVPYVSGLLLAARVRPLTWADATLGATWLIGYCAFNALSLALKASAKRRGRYLMPLTVYSLAALAAGAATLRFGGLSLLWWTPGYAVLLSWALSLVARHQERSLISGVLTIVASCGLMGILRFGTPQAILTDPNAATVADLAIIVAVTGYFVGTIWHVKALIRERNNPLSAARSAAYHGVLAMIVCGCAVGGWLGWGWAVWSVMLLVRAMLLPRYAVSRTIRPAQIGLIEFAFSTLSVALVALS